MPDLTNVPDADLVREIYRRIKGESEMHYHRNYLYREALRPIYLFFDKQDIDEANIRMRKVPDWEQIEAARGWSTSPTHDGVSGQGAAQSTAGRCRRPLTLERMFLPVLDVSLVRTVG